MRNIELNIDELVLNGFPNEQHDEIRAVFKSELTRLLSESGANPGNKTGLQPAATTQGAVEVSPARSAGIRAAHSVYGRMAR